MDRCNFILYKKQTREVRCGVETFLATSGLMLASGLLAACGGPGRDLFCKPDLVKSKASSLMAYISFWAFPMPKRPMGISL